ncbi:MAG: PepSY-associated TM helix domain-containing protein [Pseudomonadota bacterium]
MTISEAFRRSMARLHTWFGISAGAILFAIFWMGTLTVFDSEIDQWMRPELRMQLNDEQLSLDSALQDRLVGLENVTRVNISPAKPRRPILGFGYSDDEGYHNFVLDPMTGEELETTKTLGATGFFFPFHFSLHIGWKGVGYYVVGIASMAMLALMASGLFIHRKIIADFFMFRPNKALRRSTLDLHNLTGMVGLPFYFIMPISGLVIFASVYIPWSMSVPFEGDREALAKEAYGQVSIERTGVPSTSITSLDALKAKAEALWSQESGAEENADFIRIYNLGDETAYAEVRQVFPSRKVVMNPHTTSFNLQSGEMLSTFSPAHVRSAENWISGLHFIQFDHWPLRWLYFVGGLAGSVMIATGSLFWMRARTKGEEPESGSVRFIRGLTIGSTAGMVAGSAAFLLANRVLPATDTVWGLDRAMAEALVFYLVWMVAFAHAAIRQKEAWADQSFAIAAIAVLAVLANWWTTGDHILRTAAEGVWSVAGTDLTMLAGAAIAAAAGFKLRRNDQARAVRISQDTPLQPLPSAAPAE